MRFDVRYNSSGAVLRLESRDIQNMVVIQVVDKQGKQLGNLGNKMGADARWQACKQRPPLSGCSHQFARILISSHPAL